MKYTFNKFLIFITSLYFITGCSNDNNNISSGIHKTDLIKIEDAILHSNADFVNLVNSIRGSVGASGPGSKVVWSRKNDYSLGLFVSANHVYGINLWSSLNEEYIDIASINNGLFSGSKIPQVDGSPILTSELIASFGLYHPNIPSGATNSTILPENDFYIGVVDNQRVVDNGFAIYPELVQTHTPLQIFDPTSRTLSVSTWASPISNEIVVAIGYPQDKTAYPNGAVSTGKVYSDEEAQNIIQSLNQINDVEGDIPYNPHAEFLANFHAISGMSGGGVFNAEGQLLGIMVRATELNGKPVTRVIRMSYIVDKLNNFYDTLSVTDKNKLRPFISGELN
ncbi:MAG TPA: trypsin-like peptidase domain-containing protein [Flavobacterium sp.]|uniref:trypsin-like peptidase domain-containing protein n=1 Tax=unclassified Flavobacterium TaxID=196869 RepID=UPI0025C60615|nr:MULTISPECIES: trypsin-like peptidase domain-containing protein [unclassified Flavobacterium]HRE76822.1 trypsin-like peptidase domain-containing protein [Flavobacterium sp.]